MNSQTEPLILVIFGVSGDLVTRKLLPAILNLKKNNQISSNSIVLGLTRQKLSIRNILDEVKRKSPDLNEEDLKVLEDMLAIETFNVTDPNAYDELLDELNKIESDHGVCMHRLYYLSIPAQVYGPIVTFLGTHNLNGSCVHNVAATRLLIEKPFGFDLESAKELLDDTAKYFKEEQVFRVDHYLAKDAVQNIVTFRANNEIFQKLWDGKSIKRVEVSASESLGIEGRAVFYEQTGALRDLIQGHLMQVLSLLSMELPKVIDEESIHKSKVRLLKSVNTVQPNDAIRGQYESYRQEVSDPNSIVETFAGVRLNIDNDRWRNVPMVLWAGKALSRKKTQVKVVFNSGSSYYGGDEVVFSVQPNEGMSVQATVKAPYFSDTNVNRAVMNFNYESPLADAYEIILVEAIRGKHTLFATQEEVLESWRIVTPLLNDWARSGQDLKIYNNGSFEPDGFGKWLVA